MVAAVGFEPSQSKRLVFTEYNTPLNRKNAYSIQGFYVTRRHRSTPWTRPLTSNHPCRKQITIFGLSPELLSPK